jgi:hypothetical protein
VTFSVLLSPATIEHDGDGEDDDDDGWNSENGNGHLPQTFLQKSKCQANITTFIHSSIHSFIHASIHSFILSFFLTSTHYLFFYSTLFPLFRIYLFATNYSSVTHTLFLKIGIPSFRNASFRDDIKRSLEKNKTV